MDNIDFEDLCLDPYDVSMEQGRTEGRAAGLQAGFNDGRSLGRMKAIEVGTELGYMRGVAVAIKSDILPALENSLGIDDTEGRRRVEKIKKVLRELTRAIDAFPGPDDMFSLSLGSGSDAEANSEKDSGSNGGEIGRDSESNGRGTSNSSTPNANDGVDISGKLQRIRAKFKLLIVQMRLPQLSLKKIMDETVVAEEVEDDAKKLPLKGINTSSSVDTNSKNDTDW